MVGVGHVGDVLPGPWPIGDPGRHGGSDAQLGIEFVTTTRNANGTTTYEYDNGPYSDDKPLYSVADTRNARGALSYEVRANDDGTYGISVYQPGQTVTAA